MNYNDSTRTGKPHPNDGTAMRRYSQTYSYDEVGNLLEVVHTPSSGTGWTRTYTNESTSNRLHQNSIGSGNPTSETYTYDNRGNITTGFNHLTSLTYNEENRLEKVILGDTDITSYYQYDGSGQRVRKVTEDNNSNGFTQVRKYVGSWEVYDKFDGTDVVLQRETLHIMDDRSRVALIDTPVIDDSGLEVQLLRYQFSNHLGTAALELDDAAAVVSYEEYYPFGSTSFQSGRSSTEVSRKRYRYTGKERDEETGLYYHGARYYAPWICRWGAVDPKQSEMPDWSSYNYGFCNPVKWTDKTGMEPGQDEKCTNHTNTSGKQGNQTDNKSESSSNPQKAEYTVKKGDTLSAIAKEHGTTVEALAKANNISDLNKILVGQKINLLSKDNITKAIQGVVASGSANLVLNQHVRNQYLKALSKLDPTDTQGRKLLKQEYRPKTPAIERAILDNKRPMENELRRNTGIATKSNIETNRTVARLGTVGKVAGVASLGFAAYSVATADNKSKELAKQTGALAGAVAFGEAGATIGAGVGALFGGVGAIPGALIGGLVGSIGGAIFGSFAGESAYTGLTRK